MRRGIVTSSRFSPGNMSGEALEHLFVGRSELMKDVLKRISNSATRKEKHFILLVGARGMGKTHFVSLAYHKLMHDEAYAKARGRLKIAYLNEEEWGVASFLDFLVRILRALDTEQPEAGLKAKIDKIFETFKRSPASAQELAESLLIEHVKDNTLLLICENLEDLFEGLGEEGQKRWRAFIQEHRFWTILATTPALFSGVNLQASPFYNFFTIKALERLDFDTATALLRQKALMDGRPKLADFLTTPTGRARARAIHHLAGGNHRVYVIMSDFLDEESVEDLVQPFMRMADGLTPYYQDRMRQLAPQQRKLVELLCQEAQPLIVKDIASRSLMSQQVAAKQLGQLAKRQFVISTKVGRESHYELAEPLMRICVDIKDNRTEHLRLFVDFLRHWFTGRELRAKLDVLMQSGSETRLLDKLHFTAALEAFSQDPSEPFLDSLDKEARQCFEAGNYLGFLEALQHLLEERPSPSYYRQAIQAALLLGRGGDGLRYAKEAIKYSVNVVTLTLYGLALLYIGECEGAIVQFDKALKLDSKSAWAMSSKGLALVALGRIEEAATVGRELVELQASAQTALAAARLLLLTGYASEALSVLDSLEQRAPGKISVWKMRVRCLSHLSRYKEAHEVAQQATQAAPDDAEAGLLVVETAVGTVGFGASLEALAQVLANKSRHIPRFALWGTLQNVLFAENASRGATAMARQVAQLRAVLEAHQQQDALAAALSSVLQHLLPSNALASDEWLTALPILENALADMPQARIPLQMLSVAIRYKRTGDLSVLLELPLEQRTLLTDAMKEQEPTWDSRPSAS